MESNTNTTEKYLKKLGIDLLNEMQVKTAEAISKYNEIIISSPTGTGKTVGFLLPLISLLEKKTIGVQLLIIVPTRELGIQIEQVVRQMGTGHKTNVVYGGRSIAKDRIELKHSPTILIGTPGRLADHVRKETFDINDVRFLVLDEFDKSLEIGFDEDMGEILDDLRFLEKKILTSATTNIDLPQFVRIENPITLNFHDTQGANLNLKSIISPNKDKLETLLKALHHLGNKTGIIFCNFKDSINRISIYLSDNGITHGIFHGGMEQKDRERALIKFRNGTHRILLATDLAARGIDIPDLSFIIHYHLPNHKHEFVHRNGRTARMKQNGSAYVLMWVKEILPEFIIKPEQEQLTEYHDLNTSAWVTLFISGGRKDKISKGDIAGMFIKQGGVAPDDLGRIELKSDCAFISINEDYPEKVIQKVNNQRLKKKKVRIYQI